MQRGQRQAQSSADAVRSADLTRARFPDSESGRPGTDRATWLIAAKSAEAITWPSRSSASFGQRHSKDKLGLPTGGH
jgi:hypothetical protein